ncbi:MAG: 30S ribosomal protein S4 [Thermoplasmatota archaeon]
MGDPKFSRRKYDTPSHPWQAARIKEEADLERKYGLKNKTEVWKARSLLRSIRGQARDLQGKQRLESPQVRKESAALVQRLNRMGLVQETATLDDILTLNVEAVLTRRLQTQAYLKGLASTPHQARQLITHGHIAVSGGRVRVPGYIVPREEEAQITYAAGSALENEQHPVRPKVLSDEERASRRERDSRREAQRLENMRRAGRGGPSGRGRGGGSRPKGGRKHGPATPAAEGGA